jgi:hypothetical protein
MSSPRGKKMKNGEPNLNSTETREIRKFGLIALVFFGCLCILGVLLKKALPTYLFGFLSVAGLGFIFFPSYLKPLYSVWLRIGHTLGRIMTTLMLTLAYYLVITPSALIKRLFGGTPLPIKPDRQVSSYWVARTEPAQAKERFLKRY